MNKSQAVDYMSSLFLNLQSITKSPHIYQSLYFSQAHSPRTPFPLTLTEIHDPPLLQLPIEQHFSSSKLPTKSRTAPGTFHHNSQISSLSTFPMKEKVFMREEHERLEEDSQFSKKKRKMESPESELSPLDKLFQSIRKKARRNVVLRKSLLARP